MHLAQVPEHVTFEMSVRFALAENTCIAWVVAFVWIVLYGGMSAFTAALLSAISAIACAFSVSISDVFTSGAMCFKTRITMSASGGKDALFTACWYPSVARVFMVLPSVYSSSASAHRSLPRVTA